ncbi:uncharacterized protein LOC118794511 [Megalops cyprinoides]|uniref:uncharacterized protein LOC118794511 n=1 Tax=Megalops cyprinoides TaxID=118141 RepID=UPI001864B872|nr:uncharacterized protein LOC118794511 [Megalops cyprinoides]
MDTVDNLIFCHRRKDKEREEGKRESISRFQSVIEWSTQVHQGPPKTYLLKTFKEELVEGGMVRRCSFGVRDPSKMTRTIMMVGETGAGKSTLINVMVNYILRVEWDDNIRFEIIEDEGRSQTESQTTAVTVYEIYGQEGVRVPFSLRIIDTPGYGDTRGKQEDKLIAEKLHNLFKSENGVQQIDAVCFVVKSSQNRLTDTQRYIFDAILSLFGKDMKNNIMALITFHSKGKPAALEAIDKAGVPCARNEKNQPVHFKFDNVSWRDDDDDDDKEDMKNSWAKGVKNMQSFFQYLNTMEMRSVQMTQEVLMERIQLEARVQNLQERIREAEYIQNELRQTQDVVEKHKDDIDANKDFTYEVAVYYMEKVKTEQKATSCLKCERTCHYPCKFIPGTFWCAAMKGNKCTVCHGKCKPEDHVREYSMYDLKTRKEKKTSGEMKLKYDRASGEKASAESLQNTLQNELKKSEAEKKKLIDESYNCVVRLNQIALKPDSQSTLQHLDFLIARMKETEDTVRVQKLKSIKKRTEKALKNKEGGSSLPDKVSDLFK